MYVTEIKEISKSKCRISIDGEVAFALYKGDLRLYKVELNKEISSTVYKELLEKVLLKRAKLRCMNLLKARAYTEKQLRDKLKQSYYPEGITDKALLYVKQYHYVDDKRYCNDYVSAHISKLSKQSIIHKLQEKGISKEMSLASYNEMLNDIMPDNNGHDVSLCEREQIKALIQKKNFNMECADKKEINRMIAFLVRRGYQYNDISAVMRLYNENE